jgi:hypothetical protein
MLTLPGTASVGEVPFGLVEQQHRLASRDDIAEIATRVQVHHLRVAPRQDQSDPLGLPGTDSAEKWVEAVS